MADPSEYREHEEVQQWQKEKDPIELFKQYCYTNNFLSKEEAELINQEVKEVIKECLDFAENSPFPDMNVAADKIYNN